MVDAPKRTEIENLESMIGKITILWNDMHFMVFAMFVRVLRNRNSAQSIFFALHTDRAQRDVTRSLLKDGLALWPDLREHVLYLLTRIDKMAGRRNDLVHAMWTIEHPDVFPNLFEPSSPRLGAKEIKAELASLVTDIVLLRSEMGDFYEEILQTLKAHDAQFGPPRPLAPFAPQPDTVGPDSGKSRSSQRRQNKKK